MQGPGGWPAVGNSDGWPNLARRLNRLHPLARGLVGWWPMDEGRGTRARDMSTYANHGTLTGMADPATATSGWGGGKSQRDLAFDGVDDRVIVPNAAQLQITGAITLCAWIDARFTDYGTIIGKGASYPNPYTFAYYPDRRIILSRGNGSSQGYLESTYLLTGGRPEFVCATWGGGVISLYFDGVLRDSNSGSNPTCTDDGQSLYLGRRRDNVVELEGGMQHARVYNRALSAAEVKQIYADPWAGAY